MTDRQPPVYVYTQIAQIILKEGLWGAISYSEFCFHSLMITLTEANSLKVCWQRRLSLFYIRQRKDTKGQQYLLLIFGNGLFHTLNLSFCIFFYLFLDIFTWSKKFVFISFELGMSFLNILKEKGLCTNIHDFKIFAIWVCWWHFFVLPKTIVIIKLVKRLSNKVTSKAYVATERWNTNC